MPLRNTEQQNDLSSGLDLCRPAEILSVLHDGQVAASNSVASAIPDIETAAQAAAKAIASGGRLVYAAAGSSALMALADGLELSGTFGIPREQVVILVAGGPAALSVLAGGPEDDTEQAAADIENAGLTGSDCAIFLSASGTTPYALSALEAAKRLGATTIGIANNSGTPLLQRSDIPIYLGTPPEVIAGSTRMGAGTSQKIALNMLSTLMAVHLGHIHDGMMVNVLADNEKLQDRACRMVMTIGGCSIDAARRHLETAEGSVKIAVLLAAGCENSQTAKQLLESNGQKLRPSLSEITPGHRVRGTNATDLNKKGEVK